MDEAVARSTLQSRFAVSRETLDRLGRLAALVREASQSQNLISAASADHLWSRHILDSAQLLQFAPSKTGRWVDLGSGAGFPGMVIAILHDGPVTLIEERRLRIDFLRMAAEDLGIEVEIIGDKVERVEPQIFDIISARAFAPLNRLLKSAGHLSTASTCWILPKGRNAKTELEALDSSWQGEFRIEPSLTDPEAGIIVADKVGRSGPKGRR